MTTRKLTVGIPTFNGAKHIEQTIESVLVQALDMEADLIEILISDNASEDDIWEIATSYKKKYPTVFSIYRNEKNVGYDRNIDLIYKRAIGDYVWPLADDDILSSDALSKVLAVINLYPEVDLLFVGGVPESSAAKENMLCINRNDFFVLTGFRSGGISGNIIKKKVWSAIDVAKYFDTGWIHFGAILEIAAQSISYIFREPLESEIQGLSKKWGGGGTFLLVGLQLAQLFRGMKSLGYDRRCIRKAKLMIKGTYYRQICKAKAEGLLINSSVVCKFINLYGYFPSFWLVDLPLLIMPNKISRFIYRYYRHMKSSI
jgi:glycosyltransferase involved in cell wall biosynthesis